MATIAATNMLVTGAKTVNETTLNGSSDTFVYTQRKDALLVLRNPTGAAISPTIDGDGATTVPVAGVGSVDISGGYAVGSIAAGAAVAIRLDTIKEYLAGNIAITGGSGLVAQLLEF